LKRLLRTFVAERAKGQLHYNTYDTDYDRHDTAEQGVVRIWRVGSNHAFEAGAGNHTKDDLRRGIAHPSE
jgi:hypothetical protein